MKGVASKTNNKKLGVDRWNRCENNTPREDLNLLQILLSGKGAIRRAQETNAVVFFVFTYLH